MRVPLSLRLTLFFAFCIVCANVVLWGTTTLRTHEPRTVVAYSASQDLERPATEMIRVTNRAERIAARLRAGNETAALLSELREEGVEVRYERDGVRFATGDAVPAVEDGLSRSLGEPGKRPGRSYVAQAIGTERWLVVYPEGYQPPVWSDPLFLRLLLGQMALVIALCAVFALWQLRPLKALMAATGAVGSLELSHEVRIRQRSELGDLASAFNAMTSRIRRLLEAKEELLVSVSHELRSPITRIRLAMEVEGARSLPRIHRNIERMEKLLSELLDSLRLGSGAMPLEKSRFDLRGLFEDLASDYGATFPGGIVWSVERGGGQGCEVSADRERLRRVLVNLIENSLKYRGEDRSPVELLATTEADGGARVEVRDRGPGIPEPLLHRVCDPFYRVDESRNEKTGGYGLGLAVCRKIVEAHGGSLSLRNRDGGGLSAVFRVSPG